MKSILLAFVFYGLVYYVFESLFNYLSMVLFSNRYTWKDKLKLKPNVSSSFWMIPVGALSGFILHLYLMIPLNYSNVFILFLLGLVSCAVITGLEYLSGYYLNIKLKLNLWKYDSKINWFGKEYPLNYKAQIDFYHSIGWFFIAYPFLIIDKVLL